jgi:hypothetical protein
LQKTGVQRHRKNGTELETGKRLQNFLPNTKDMEQDQKGQQGEQKQQPVGEQNPTLHQPGTQVADYGNVTGGSADGDVEGSGETENANRSGGDTQSDTVGNP